MLPSSVIVPPFNFTPAALSASIMMFPVLCSLLPTPNTTPCTPFSPVLPVLIVPLLYTVAPSSAYIPIVSSLFNTIFPVFLATLPLPVENSPIPPLPSTLIVPAFSISPMYLGVITVSLASLGECPLVKPEAIPILYKSLAVSEAPTVIIPVFLAFCPYEYIPIFP